MSKLEIALGVLVTVLIVIFCGAVGWFFGKVLPPFVALPLSFAWGWFIGGRAITFTWDRLRGVE